jgi:hypothetical protein
MRRHRRAERLLRCGHQVAPEPPPGDWTRGDDLALLRDRARSTTSGAAWLPMDEPAPLTRILYTAHRLGRAPTEVARRLEQLGHALPDDIEFTEPEQP